MGIALNYPHHRRHHHYSRCCYHLFDSIRAIHSKGLREVVTKGGGDFLIFPGFAAIQIVWLVVVLMTQVLGKLVDDEDDQRGGLCLQQAGGGRRRGRGKGEELTKEARRPFTKCSSPRLPCLAAKPLQKNPHFEKNGPTKLPSQMGHKGSGAVYRTFRPPCPARLPACLHQLCV